MYSTGSSTFYVWQQLISHECEWRTDQPSRTQPYSNLQAITINQHPYQSPYTMALRAVEKYFNTFYIHNITNDIFLSIYTNDLTLRDSLATVFKPAHFVNATKVYSKATAFILISSENFVYKSQHISWSMILISILTLELSKPKFLISNCFVVGLQPSITRSDIFTSLANLSPRLRAWQSFDWTTTF